MTRCDPAWFEVRALYGPPRPVLVVGVHGEVDRSNEAELLARVWRTGTLSGTTHCRQYYGARWVAPAVVLDLRAARFVGVSALVRLSDHARHHQPLRLLLDPTSPLGGVLERVATVLELGFEIHHDIADAVLADVAVLD